MQYYVTFHQSHENFRSKKGANQGANERNTYNLSSVVWTQGLTYLCKFEFRLVFDWWQLRQRKKFTFVYDSSLHRLHIED